MGSGRAAVERLLDDDGTGSVATIELALAALAWIADFSAAEPPYGQARSLLVHVQ